MKGILLLSHGKMAEGLLDTLKMFSGDIENIDTLELAPGADLLEFYNEVEKKVIELDVGDGVVIFADLLYGTPSNMSTKLLQNEEYKDKVEVITGMNLPMVLEYTSMRNSEFNVGYLIDTGTKGIKSIKDLM